MSRIGKQIIPVPSGVVITPDETQYTVTGSKGTLIVPRFPGVEITQVDATAQVVVVGDPEDAQTRSFYGLLRVLMSNAVIGVSTGWTRDLELHGVGMRAALAGTTLNLSLGFSHPVHVEAPAGVSFNVVKNVITVSGIDKQLVGETAAKIRQLRKPEPYKGKGIRYAGEYIRRKAGKTGKAAK
jgi:large subunit ribosomal protein L6